MEIERFRLPDSIVNTKKFNPKIKKDSSGISWFVRGPISGPWIGSAAKLPGHALHTAMAILHVSGLTKQGDVLLDRFHLNRFGVEKDSARRALERLQKAGLIDYEKVGHKFKVTILGDDSS